MACHRYQLRWNPSYTTKAAGTWVNLECKDIWIKVIRQVENIEEDKETGSSESENLNEELLIWNGRTSQLELSAGSSMTSCAIPSESDCCTSRCEELKDVKGTSGPIRGRKFEEVFNSLLALPSEFMANISCAMKGVGAIIVDSGQVFCGCRVSENLVLIPNHGLEKILEISYDVMIQFHHFKHKQCPNSYMKRQVSSFLLDKSKFFTDNILSGLDFALIAINPCNLNDDILLNKATILTNACPKMKKDLFGTCIHLGFFSRSCDQFVKVRAEIIQLEDEHSETLKKLNGDRNMILYVADTKEGCSGAPLFNDQAEIVGIHLGTKTLKCHSTSTKYHFGYGLLITAILRDLYVSLSDGETSFERMLKNSEMSSEMPFPHHQKELKKSTTQAQCAQHEKKDDAHSPEL